MHVTPDNFCNGLLVESFSSSVSRREKEMAKEKEREKETTPNESSMQSNGAEGVHRLKGMKTCPSSRIFILRYFLVTRLRVVYTAIPLFLPWMRLLEHVDRPLRMIFSMNTPLHSRLRATPRNFDRFSHLFSPFFAFFLFFNNCKTNRTTVVLSFLSSTK